MKRSISHDAAPVRARAPEAPPSPEGASTRARAIRATSPFSRALWLLFVAGCTPPGPAVTPPGNTGAPAPSGSAKAAPERDATAVSVVPVHAPAGLVLDGDLGEWGAFPPPPESLDRPPSNDDPRGPYGAPLPSEEAPPPNPEDAASRVAFALTGEQALLAADLGEAARDGVWVGVGAQVPDLPLLGEYFGRMGFVVLDCETMPVVEGEEGDQGYRVDPRPPELADACRGLQARRAEAKAKHAARFEKLFKIDRDGVRLVGPGGALAAIEGAKSAWKAGPEGATVEVSLPLSAMPRLGEAPLVTLRLAARIAAAAPVIARGEWVWVELPEPVAFEPYGELRAHALRRANDVGEWLPGTISYKQPRTVSYQPGDALHIEAMDSQTCNLVSAHEMSLFEKLATFGDAEIGIAAAPRGRSCWIEPEPWVAILRNGKVTSLFEPKGAARSTFVRDGELHILSFENKSYSAVPGIWSALALSPGGARREIVVKPVPGTKEPDFASYWQDATDFADKDAGTFGWRGTKKGKAMEATWKWDAAARVYKGTQRELPSTKKKKK